MASESRLTASDLSCMIFAPCHTYRWTLPIDSATRLEVLRRTVLHQSAVEQICEVDVPNEEVAIQLSGYAEEWTKPYLVRGVKEY